MLNPTAIFNTFKVTPRSIGYSYVPANAIAAPIATNTRSPNPQPNRPIANPIMNRGGIIQRSMKGLFS